MCISRQSLSYRIKNNSRKRVGGQCIFNSQQETVLKDKVFEMAAQGFPVTIERFRSIAYQYACNLKIKCPQTQTDYPFDTYMTYSKSGYSCEEIFMDFLKHFQKHQKSKIGFNCRWTLKPRFFTKHTVLR